MRPTSIVQFERLYWGALVVWLLSYALGWTGYVDQAIAEQPELGASMVTVLIGLIVLAALVQLALGYFAARRGAVLAKWAIALWFVIAMAQLALQLFRGGFAINLGIVAWIVWFAIFGWSVSYLFKPDADAWFAKQG